MSGEPKPDEEPLPLAVRANPAAALRGTEITGDNPFDQCQQLRRRVPARLFGLIQVRARHDEF